MSTLYYFEKARKILDIPPKRVSFELFKILEKAVRAGKLRVNAEGFESTPLTLAANFGDHAFVEYLLTNGAPVTYGVERDGKTFRIPNEQGITALNTALKQAIHMPHDRSDYLECAKLLIRHGVASFDHLKEAILCDDLELVELLISEIEKNTKKNITPLINTSLINTSPYLLAYATDVENVEIINLLLAHGADVTKKSQDHDHKYPYQIAIEKNNISLLKKLIPSDGINLEEVIEHCALFGTGKALEILWQNKNEQNPSRKALNNALQHAISKNKLTLAKMLIDKGANPNVIDENGMNVLHKAVLMADKELIKFLLPLIKNIYAKTNNGKTVIDIAIENYDAQTVKLLQDYNPKFEIDAQSLLQITTDSVANLAVKNYTDIPQLLNNNNENRIKDFLKKVYKEKENQEEKEGFVPLVKKLFSYLQNEIKKQNIVSDTDKINEFKEACSKFVINSTPKEIANAKEMLEVISFFLVADDSNSKDLKADIIIDLIDPLLKCIEGAHGEIQSKYILLNIHSLIDLMRLFAKDAIEKVFLKNYESIHERNTCLSLARDLGLTILGNIQRDEYTGSIYGEEESIAKTLIKDSLDKNFTPEEFLESTISSFSSTLSLLKLQFTIYEGYSEKIIRALKTIDLNPEEFDLLFNSNLKISYTDLSKIIDAAQQDIDEYKFIEKEIDPSNVPENKLYILTKDEEIHFLWSGKKYYITNKSDNPSLYEDLLNFNARDIRDLALIFNATRRTDDVNKYDVGSPYITINKEFLEYKILAKMLELNLLRSTSPYALASDILNKFPSSYMPVKKAIVENFEHVTIKFPNRNIEYYLKNGSYIDKKILANDPEFINGIQKVITNIEPKEFLELLKKEAYPQSLINTFIKSYSKKINVMKLLDVAVDNEDAEFIAIIIDTATPNEIAEWSKSKSSRDKFFDMIKIFPISKLEDLFSNINKKQHITFKNYIISQLIKMKVNSSMSIDENDAQRLLELIIFQAQNLPEFFTKQWITESEQNSQLILKIVDILEKNNKLNDFYANNSVKKILAANIDKKHLLKEIFTNKILPNVQPISSNELLISNENFKEYNFNILDNMFNNKKFLNSDIQALVASINKNPNEIISWLNARPDYISLILQYASTIVRDRNTDKYSARREFVKLIFNTKILQLLKISDNQSDIKVLYRALTKKLLDNPENEELTIIANNMSDYFIVNPNIELLNEIIQVNSKIFQLKKYPHGVTDKKIIKYLIDNPSFLTAWLKDTNSKQSIENLITYNYPVEKSWNLDETNKISLLLLMSNIASTNEMTEYSNIINSGIIKYSNQHYLLPMSAMRNTLLSLGRSINIPHFLLRNPKILKNIIANNRNKIAIFSNKFFIKHVLQGLSNDEDFLSEFFSKHPKLLTVQNQLDIIDKVATDMYTGSIDYTVKLLEEIFKKSNLTRNTIIESVKLMYAQPHINFIKELVEKKPELLDSIFSKLELLGKPKTVKFLGKTLYSYNDHEALQYAAIFKEELVEINKNKTLNKQNEGEIEQVSNVSLSDNENDDAINLDSTETHASKLNKAFLIESELIDRLKSNDPRAKQAIKEKILLKFYASLKEIDKYKDLDDFAIDEALKQEFLTTKEYDISDIIFNGCIKTIIENKDNIRKKITGKDEEMTFLGFLRHMLKDRAKITFEDNVHNVEDILKAVADNAEQIINDELKSISKPDKALKEIKSHSLKDDGPAPPPPPRKAEPPPPPPKANPPILPSKMMGNANNGGLAQNVEKKPTEGSMVSVLKQNFEKKPPAPKGGA